MLRDDTLVPAVMLTETSSRAVVNTAVAVLVFASVHYLPALSGHDYLDWSKMIVAPHDTDSVAIEITTTMMMEDGEGSNPRGDADNYYHCSCY